MIDLAKKFLHENIYFELYHHRAIYTNEDALDRKSVVQGKSVDLGGRRIIKKKKNEKKKKKNKNI